MELTKEYFDSQLNKHLKNLVTKGDLSMTKNDLEESLKSQTKDLKSYTDEVAATILEAVDTRFNEVDQRLGNIETSMVTKDGLEQRLSLLPDRQEFNELRLDVLAIKEKVNEINERDIKDSNALAKNFVNHEKRVSRLENVVYKKKVAISAKSK
jgi:hypothetical protein